jgi:hypothetical protein
MTEMLPSLRLLPAKSAFERRLSAGIATACLALTACVPASVLAVGAAGAKTEAAPEVTAVRSTISQPMPPRAVEVVIVWGFRLRPNIHDTRNITLNAGYNELVGRDVCITSTCGFVVVRDGTQWRATNVMAGTEAELIEMQQNMDRQDTTIVIVHPTGIRRSVPKF